MANNYLIGKIGRSIQFDKSKWKLKGGDEGIYNLIEIFGRHFKEDTFYICSRSNYDRFKLYDNVKQLPVDDYKSPLEYIERNSIKFSAGIFINGISVNTSLPNTLYKEGSNEFLKVLNIGKTYVAPIVYCLNALNIPFLTISEDPRNTNLKSKDLFNVEKKCLSFEDSVYKRSHIKSYSDHTRITNTVNVEFSPLYYLHLLNKDPLQDIPVKGHRSQTLNIFMNKFGLDSKHTRRSFVDEYIFSNFPNTKIYGLWDPDDGDRFENKKMVDIPEILSNTLYTVIYSLKPGFISPKPFEMINKGIIPFLHPDYDKNHLLDFPDFLYLKDPEDLVNKISLLEDGVNGELLYNSLWRSLIHKVKNPSIFDGTLIANYLKEQINEILST